MKIIQEYISYIRSVRRYSPRTVDVYGESLEMFATFLHGQDKCASAGAEHGISTSDLTPTNIRNYEMYLLEDRGMTPRTVNLHISVISGLCGYLVKQGMLGSNPAKTVKRPKTEKRLPEFYHSESLSEYFKSTEPFAGNDFTHISEDPKQTKWMYCKRLERLIISILYCTGIRRAELIGLNIADIDFSRKTARIKGKGDKVREIPLVPPLCQEILLYLQAVETMTGVQRDRTSPLLVTFSGNRLYPVYVDRALKSGLGSVGSITGRKSPHVLRHTIATELLNEGTDINSIKELLGHSSLAATQVYTHNSIGKLKKVYKTAHPRASKNGGKNGD